MCMKWKEEVLCYVILFINSCTSCWLGQCRFWSVRSCHRAREASFHSWPPWSVIVHPWRKHSYRTTWWSRGRRGWATGFGGERAGRTESPYLQKTKHFNSGSLKEIDLFKWGKGMIMAAYLSGCSASKWWGTGLCRIGSVRGRSRWRDPVRARWCPGRDNRYPGRPAVHPDWSYLRRSSTWNERKRSLRKVFSFSISVTKWINDKSDNPNRF